MQKPFLVAERTPRRRTGKPASANLAEAKTLYIVARETRDSPAEATLPAALTEGRSYGILQIR